MTIRQDALLDRAMVVASMLAGCGRFCAWPIAAGGAFVDTAGSSALTTSESEFDRARTADGGLRAAVHVAGSLTDEMVVREIWPFSARSLEPGQPAFRHVFSGAAAVKCVLWRLTASAAPSKAIPPG